MQKKETAKLSRKVTVRFTPEEYKKDYLSYKTTTKRKLSEYIRSILLDKPVTIYTRNQSFDDFVAELILLRSELNAIGNSFKQAVRKLHTLESVSSIQSWAIHNEKTKEVFFRK